MAGLFSLPAAVELAGGSRGGGGGRPGEGVNMAPELAREGGRMGPEEPEPRLYGRETLVEGVGGRIEDDEEVTDEGGLTGVLLLRRQRWREKKIKKIKP